MDWIAKRASVAIEADFHYIACSEYDPIAEGQGVGSVEMHMDAAGLTMSGELEMMVLHVGEAVAHVLLAAGDLPMPENGVNSLDADLALDVIEVRAYD